MNNDKQITIDTNLPSNPSSSKSISINNENATSSSTSKNNLSENPSSSNDYEENTYSGGDDTSDKVDELPINRLKFKMKLFGRRRDKTASFFAALNARIFQSDYNDILDDESKSAVFHIVSACVPRYMFNLILKNGSISNGYKQMEAIIGFFDFTGYTKLAEFLSQRERRTTFGKKMDMNRGACLGAEELMKVLNDYFMEIIRIIHENDGDILKFAGDAVLVWWPIEDQQTRTKWIDNDNLNNNNNNNNNNNTMDKKTYLTTRTRLADKALLTCWEILQSLEILNFKHDLTLQIKLGLSIGETTFIVLNHSTFDRSECLISGDVISKAGKMAEVSKSVNIGLSSEFYECLSHKEIFGEGIKVEGGILIPNSTELPDGYIPDSQLVKISADSSRASLGSNYINNNNNNNLFEKNSLYDENHVPFEIQPQLLSFIPDSIRDGVQAGPGDISSDLSSYNKHVDLYTGWLSEIRRLSIMFINFPDLSCEASQFKLVEQIYKSIIMSITVRKGILRQFIVDDKGCVMICIFGLKSLLGYAANSVKCGMDILEKLEGMNVRASIGITTGICYCGVIGSANRCEYTISGDVVNLSARIMVEGKKMMAKYNRDNIMLCDEETRDDSRNLIYYQYISKVKVKGKEVLINIYEPFEQVFIGSEEDYIYNTEIRPQIWRAGLHCNCKRQLMDVDEENCQKKSVIRTPIHKVFRNLNKVHPVSGNNNHNNNLNVSSQLNMSPTQTDLIIRSSIQKPRSSSLELVQRDSSMNKKVSIQSIRLVSRLNTPARGNVCKTPPRYDSQSKLIVVSPTTTDKRGSTNSSLSREYNKRASTESSCNLQLVQDSDSSNNNNNNSSNNKPKMSMKIAALALRGVFSIGSSVQFAKHLERFTALPLMILKVASVVALFSNKIHYVLLYDILPMKSFKPLLRETLDELESTGVLIKVAAEESDKNMLNSNNTGSNSNQNESNLNFFVNENTDLPVYRFKHEHAIEVLHEELLLSQRRDLHGAVATWYEKSVGNRLSDLDSELYAVISYHWTMSPEERTALAKSVLYMHLAAKKAVSQEKWPEAIDYLLKTLELLDANKKYGLTAFTIAFDAPLAHCYLATAYNKVCDESKCLEHIKEALMMYNAPIPSSRLSVIVNVEGEEHLYSFKHGISCMKKLKHFIPSNSTPVNELENLYKMYIDYVDK